MKRSPLLPIFLIVLADILGLTILLPLLPFYAEKLGASPTVVGLLVSVYAFCQLISGPFLGRWSDRIGRKPLLIVSQLGTLASRLLLAVRRDALAGVPGANHRRPDRRQSGPGAGVHRRRHRAREPDPVLRRHRHQLRDRLPSRPGHLRRALRLRAGGADPPLGGPVRRQHPGHRGPAPGHQAGRGTMGRPDPRVDASRCSAGASTVSTSGGRGCRGSCSSTSASSWPSPRSPAAWRSSSSAGSPGTDVRSTPARSASSSPTRASWASWCRASSAGWRSASARAWLVAVGFASMTVGYGLLAGVYVAAAPARCRPLQLVRHRRPPARADQPGDAGGGQERAGRGPGPQHLAPVGRADRRACHRRNPDRSRAARRLGAVLRRVRPGGSGGAEVGRGHDRRR